MQSHPHYFRAHLTIDVDGRPRRLVDVQEPWQAADMAALDPGWVLAVHGQRTRHNVIQRGYLERPRGHSKTTDIAVQSLWAIFAARKQVRGVAAAGSRDQAQLLRDAAETIFRRNEWMHPFLAIRNYRVENLHTGSTLDILAADAQTNYGLTPDFIVCDEITHWPEGKGKPLWDALFSAAAKRPNCLMLVIANAGNGKGRSWQWQAREICRDDPGWYFSRINGPQASWITPKVLAEQQRHLTPAAYNRLWLNEWQTGEGDALDLRDIQACCVLTKPWDVAGCNLFVAGLDLGVKHDHAALVVLGLDYTRSRIKLVECIGFAPSPATGQVDLMAVESAVLSAVAHTKNMAAVYYDPHQAALMAQRLAKHDVNMVEVPFVPSALKAMAVDLLGCITCRRIELYPDPLLLEDLMRLSIVEKSYGFRLEAISDERGHADRATALAIALPKAVLALADDLLAFPPQLPEASAW